MATTTNIQVLLKYYATRQNSAIVNVADFSEYMRRYAQHHVEEQPDLIQYLSNSLSLVKAEIAKLEEAKQVIWHSPETDKQEIIVIAYFIEKFATRYQEIKKNPAIPYPSHLYLPKNIPAEVYKKENADTFFAECLGNPENTEKSLFCIQLPRGLPTILFPSTLPITILLEIAYAKLRIKLAKEEFHEYFLKKLKIANPGKEISVKNFFTALTQKPELAMSSMKDSTESFYQWNQLCFFIKQDFENIKDLTQEDLALLQSVAIIEYCTSYYRTKSQQDLQRTTAFKNLELVLNKPPYYFTRATIDLFTDSRGIPLLGQYSESDLNDYLHKVTTESIENKLPQLLTFKAPNNTRYYISKQKVFPLIVRLCSDARETVKNIVTKDYFASLKRFESVAEMKSNEKFEEKLANLVEKHSPILHTLLNSSFLSSVYFEIRAQADTSPEVLQLFHDGKIPSYSELLMISKDEILTDAKIMLPMWYTMPVVSWILAFFLGPKKSKTKIKKSSSNKTTALEEQKKAREEEILTAAEKRDPAISRKMELKQAAMEAEKFFVPSSSTLERELASYEQVWNKMINKQSRENLTEDVNSLIRDYIRKIIKTLKASNFTPERIKNLAEVLVKTPGMQKIKDQPELCMYIQLYMVKLIKNIP
ncbi:MAG: hypothetical protein E7063_06350 [Spirochaetaceae bacterium]|nr:hypothetical protein [Spirochaetaceae bacterium]